MCQKFHFCSCASDCLLKNAKLLEENCKDPGFQTKGPDYCKGSTYLFDVPLSKFILSQYYDDWLKMETYSPTNFLSLLDIIFLTVTENKFIVWDYHFLGRSSIYSFEFSNINGRIKHKICLNLNIKVPDIFLRSLLLTLNIFNTLF